MVEIKREIRRATQSTPIGKQSSVYRRNFKVQTTYFYRNLNTPPPDRTTLVSQTASLLAADFDIVPATTEAILTEEQLLAMLSQRVAQLMETRMDYLLSLMYRLDVLEHHINAALLPTAEQPPHIGLAQLIIDRQKQRIFYKQQYHSKPASEDELEGLGL